MKEFMNIAIDESRKAIETKEGGPFGAAIVMDDEVISQAHNTVFYSRDPTAHAEINAIRAAGKKLGYDLSGCVIFSTTEPCPMCFSASHWAGIKRIVFGASIEDVEALGFREIPLKNDAMKWLGQLDVEVEGGFMREECMQVFDEWKASRLPTY